MSRDISSWVPRWDERIRMGNIKNKQEASNMSLGGYCSKTYERKLLLKDKSERGKL